MKLINFIAVIFSMVLALPAYAQVSDSAITTFEDGTPAVAGEVNANFQALADAINALADRVGSLESSSDSDNGQGFSGSYTITGVGMDTDCSDTISNAIAISMFGITGSGVAADGVLSFTLTDKKMAPILRDNGTGTFEVEARAETNTESSSISFDSNGVFSGIDAGSFTADGSAFVLTNSNAGCPGDVTHIVGVRN